MSQNVQIVIGWLPEEKACNWSNYFPQPSVVATSMRSTEKDKSICGVAYGCMSDIQSVQNYRLSNMVSARSWITSLFICLTNVLVSQQDPPSCGIWIWLVDEVRLRDTRQAWSIGYSLGRKLPHFRKKMRRWNYSQRGRCAQMEHPVAGSHATMTFGLYELARYSRHDQAYWEGSDHVQLQDLRKGISFKVMHVWQDDL